MEKILVLDFGGQYNQLIARRVREQNIYAEIKPYNKITIAQIINEKYKGIIFTGGPNSVYDEASPHYDKEILNAGIPILGICYGDQLMAYMAGGSVVHAKENSEYGKAELCVRKNILFEGLPEKSICWMSHTDRIEELPQGFKVIASTEKCPVAAMCNEEKKLYGLQFHPEVTHTVYGNMILKNFLYQVCGCSGDWKVENLQGREAGMT